MPWRTLECRYLYAGIAPQSTGERDMAILDLVLERFSWIFGEGLRCVREPSYCLTTVQFWVAVATGTGLVLGFARWMTMKVRKNTVEDRLGRIEERVGARSEGKSILTDCELIRAHRTLFTRPAFTRSCIQELSILLLADVVDETIAALGTGKHYDAKGQARGDFGDLHHYRRRSHRANIVEVYERLQALQWVLKDFDGFLRACPEVNYPTREFISAGLPMRIDAALWKQILERCDQVDIERNAIIQVFNNMLDECDEPPLSTIPLSSRSL